MVCVGGCGAFPFQMVPSLVLGNLLSLKQRQSSYLIIYLGTWLVTTASTLRKISLMRLMCLQLEQSFPHDYLTCYYFSFQNSLKDLDGSEAHWVRLSFTSWEGASVSWILSSGIMKFHVRHLVFWDSKKVISKAFIIKVLLLFSCMHWEDGSAISLTFLSELVFEPLDDSDKCHCCHWLSFNYTWVKLSVAASRKLN